MRGLKRQKQTVYWSKVTEILDGIDTVPFYSQPQSFKFSVSSTAGTPEEISAGIVPDYDRYITSFDRSFHGTAHQKTEHLLSSVMALTSDLSALIAIRTSTPTKETLQVQQESLQMADPAEINAIFAVIR